MRFDTNSYSVPVKYAHRQITVVATVDEVRLVYDDRLVARHPRSWRKEQYLYNPIHYLALLERKPGGFDHAKPLEHWELPASFALLRRRLEAADSRHGTRQFIRVLRLLERYPLPRLSDAVEYALDIDVAGSRQHPRDRGAPRRATGRVLLARRPTSLASGPRRDDGRFGLSGLARGGGVMSKTETKSTVLLKHHLKQLRLPTMHAECEKIAARAASDNVDHLGFLLQLTELELIERERKSAERRLKAARFPV